MYVDTRTGQTVDVRELGGGLFFVQYHGGDRARGRISSEMFFRFFKPAYEQQANDPKGAA